MSPLKFMLVHIPILRFRLLIIRGIGAIVPIVPNAAVLMVTIDIMTHYHPTPHRSEFIMFENSCCNLCS